MSRELGPSSTARSLKGRVALLALLLAGAFVIQRASADQPHMEAALDHLKAAQAELAQAAKDKGGHRVAAEKHVREAIVEVEKGIAFARKH